MMSRKGTKSYRDYGLSDSLLPFFRFEKYIHPHADTYHKQPCAQVAVFPTEFGHVVEVHAPYPGKKGERYEDGRDDGQPFHDGVHAQIVVRYIQVDQRREGLATDFDVLGDIIDVVVEVIEKGSVGLVYQGRVGAYQSHILLFERRDRAFEQEVPPSQGLYFDAYFVCAFFEQKFRLQVFERVVDLGRY